MNTKITTIEEYISQFPADIQDILKKIDAIIMDVAPKAHRSISYGMPAYKTTHPLIYFAKQKNHIGIYPTPSSMDHFKDKFVGYKTSKGALQLPLDKPIPYKLIEEITKFRYHNVTN